jgi:hypothetical protein
MAKMMGKVHSPKVNKNNTQPQAEEQAYELDEHEVADAIFAGQYADSQSRMRDVRARLAWMLTDPETLQHGRYVKSPDGQGCFITVRTKKELQFQLDHPCDDKFLEELHQYIEAARSKKKLGEVKTAAEKA